MLISCGAKNFYSFKEGVEISFELSARCPKNISRGNSLANLICVQGANASGKTNALRLLPFLASFCTNSFNYEPGGNIPISSFFSNSEPIQLYCEFIVDDISYVYEVSLVEERVLKESLTRTVNRPSLLFVWEGGSFRKCIREFDELKSMKVRPNASIISTAHQYGIELLAPVYGFFSGVLSNVTWMGKREHRLDLRLIAGFYHETPEALRFSLELIRKFDVGIQNIEIIEVENPEEGEAHFPRFTHLGDASDTTLLWAHQSSGTKELFSVLPLSGLLQF